MDDNTDNTSQTEPQAQAIEQAQPAPEAQAPSDPMPEPTDSVVTADSPELATAGDGVALAHAEHPALPDPGPAMELPEIDPRSMTEVEVDIEPPRWPYGNQQPPSMGRIVHYHAANGGEKPDGNDYHAAIITKVNFDWSVSLSVFPEGRMPMFVSNIQFDGDGESSPGTWCWPPRV